ncbi:MAG: hypothetical protein OEV78_06865 [Spirochaetia bacterium]|nr:hypothetical protein [Spirochaetia bacterium]
MSDIYTEKKRQTVFLSLVLSGFAVIYFFSGIFNLAVAPRPVLGIIEIVMGVLYLISYKWTKRSGSISFASWFLVLSMSLFFVLFFYQYKGNYYSISLAFIVPAMIFVLFPKKAGLLLYSLYSVAVFFVLSLHAYNEGYLQLSSYVLNLVIAFVATGGVFYYSETIKSDALGSLIKISDALSSQKEKLEKNYNRSKAKEAILTNLIEEKSRAIFQEKNLLERNYKRTKAKEDSLTRLIEDKSREIFHEKEKSESLLLNILPHSIVEELKKSEEVKPLNYSSATILFSDFVGFTKIAETTPPEKLVKNLDYCFSRFELISEKLNIEKIKTIGDAYMCAGGLPVANRTHSVDACLTALKMMDFVRRWNLARENKGLKRWDIRIGINTGPCIAGIIGKKKFAYDVWGDAVNIASRMESSGLAGEINLSESTKNIVDQFFVTEPRGFVMCKNKGEMAMFLLKSIRPELSENGKGTRPNQTFVKMYMKMKNSAENNTLLESGFNETSENLIMK